jgi:hypothetical protein
MANRIKRTELDAAPIQNLDSPYADLTTMYADQANQTTGYAQRVTGDSILYYYLGTTTGDITDYLIFGVDDSNYAKLDQTNTFVEPQIIGAPTTSTHAATKQYVDDNVAYEYFGQISGDSIMDAADVKTKSGFWRMSLYDQHVHPSDAPAGFVYSTGSSRYSHIFYTTDGTTRQLRVTDWVGNIYTNFGTGGSWFGWVKNNSASGITDDSNYAKLDQDNTFTQPQTVGEPTSDGHAATKSYVDGIASGSDSVAYKEVPSGAVDGVNTIFTTINTPLSIDFIWLFINGVARTGFTYDAPSKQITLDFAPTTGSLIEVQYISSLADPFPDVTVHNSLSGLNTGNYLHITPTEKSNYDIAFTHSQEAHPPADAQKNSDITLAEIESALVGTISSHEHDMTDGIGITELKDELKATAAPTTTNVDWSQGIQFPIPMTENTTLTFSNIVQTKAIMLVVTGNYTLTLPTGVDPADLSGFVGTNTNYINIYCVDSTTPVFLTTLISK